MQAASTCEINKARKPQIATKGIESQGRRPCQVAMVRVIISVADVPGDGFGLHARTWCRVERRGAGRRGQALD
eukprot:364662-Chlamydomonas_euryale.AAC.1